MADAENRSHGLLHDVRVMRSSGFGWESWQGIVDHADGSITVTRTARTCKEAYIMALDHLTYADYRMEQSTDPDIRARLPPEGPWADEPDRVEWLYATGFSGIAQRHPTSGHWCGYLVLPEDHPWRDQEDLSEIRVHGGVTFFGLAKHLNRPEDYVVGFDCHHLGDLGPIDPPSIQKLYRNIDGTLTYKDMDYVLTEIHRLHVQAIEALDNEP